MSWRRRSVSKVEGRVVRIDESSLRQRARELAGDERDPREVEVILREAGDRASARAARDRRDPARVRSAPPPASTTRTRPSAARSSCSRSTRTRARAGSASARELTGRDVGVIVTDSFGRPFRQGTTDVAIGVAGITPLIDLRGTTRPRSATSSARPAIAVADEIAAAADLARGKADGVPVVVVRGLAVQGEGTARELVIEPELDLFR